MYTSDLFQSKSHINEDQECQVLYINDKPVAKYADPMQAKTQLAHLQSKFPAKKIELKKEMREGGQCNMTAEGQHCPAHGLAECGMWEASDPSGMMHAARHYNKSFIITAELAEGGTKKYRIHAQSERVAREKFSQHYNMAKVLSVEEEGMAEGLPGEFIGGTAGGIGGAVVGNAVAGPMGALVGGAAGGTAGQIAGRKLTDEQKLNEIAPLLMAGARLFMAAAPKIAQVFGKVGQAGARGVGQAAKAGAGIAAKNAGQIGVGVGAYEIGSSVADIVKEITAAVGAAVDEKTIFDLATLAFKYAIPAGIVLAILYGGKKAIDSLFADPKTTKGVVEGSLEANTPNPVVVIQDLNGKILDTVNLSVAVQKYKLGNPQDIKNQLAHQAFTTIGNYIIASPMAGQPQDKTTKGVAEARIETIHGSAYTIDPNKYYVWAWDNAVVLYGEYTDENNAELNLSKIERRATKRLGPAVKGRFEVASGKMLLRQYGNEQGMSEGLKQTLRRFDPTIKARIRGKSQDQTNQGLDTIQHLADLDLTSDDMVSRAMKPNTYFRNAERYAKLANKGMAEGNPTNPFKPQGNFVGDSPQPQLGVTATPKKSVQIGDTVTYLTQPARVMGMSKDRKYSRIKISNGMGSVTQDVLTSDLKSGRFWREDELDEVRRTNPLAQKLRDLERRQGALTKPVEQMFHVKTDQYGANKDVPLYTKTYSVRADSEQEAINTVIKIFGGTNHRIEQGVAEGSLEEIDRRGFLKGMGAAAVAGAAGSAMAKRNNKLDDPMAIYLIAWCYGVSRWFQMWSPSHFKKFPFKEVYNITHNIELLQAEEDSEKGNLGFEKWQVATEKGRKDALSYLKRYQLGPGQMAESYLFDIYEKLKVYYNKLNNILSMKESVQQGVAEGLPDGLSKSDYTPGATKKHVDTNCTTCHGRKSMYKLDGKLFADNKVGAERVKCPTCKGTGDKPGVAEAQNDYFKRRKDEEDRIAGTKAPAKRTPKQTDYEKKRKEQDKDIAEGGMPSSVIKSKQRYGDMSDKDFAELHQSKSDDDLVAMAWRHGYGKGSLHYVNKRKRGLARVEESRLYYNVIGTRDKDLKESFGMQQDQKGWFLEATAGRKRILEAHKAFGAPTII